MLDDALSAAPRSLVWVLDGATPGQLAGFMLADRPGVPDPGPDNRLLTVQLVASRVELTPVADRARFRLTALTTFMALTAYCAAQGFIWRARFLAGGPHFAIATVLAEMVGNGSRVTMTADPPWTLVVSHDPVQPVAGLTWPAS